MKIPSSDKEEKSFEDTVNQVRSELDNALGLVKEEVNKAVPFVFERIQVYFKHIPDANRVIDICLPFVRSILHVLVHEISHVVVENVIQELDLSVRDKCLVYEVMARFIERRLSSELKDELDLKMVIVESFEEQVSELSRYPELASLKIDEEEYKRAYEGFWRGVEEGKSPEKLAEIVLKMKTKRE